MTLGETPALQKGPAAIFETASSPHFSQRPLCFCGSADRCAERLGLSEGPAQDLEESVTIKAVCTPGWPAEIWSYSGRVRIDPGQPKQELGVNLPFEMEFATSSELRSRVEDRIRDWRVVVERTSETESSFIAFGRRDSQPVVLKVLRNHGEEWRSGEILEAFEGRGVVRVYEYVEGAILLERLSPGDSLVAMALDGRDDQATEILAEVIGKMSPRPSVKAVPTVQEWAKGFERYAASGDGQIPKNLLEEGHRVYAELCGSQSQPRLLHGDLHHYNVLFDSERGWLAIDPKGVVGELEYEVGAALRNPYERPDLFAEPATIEKRLKRFAFKLDLDARRTLGWGFAQAVLSAIWAVEDGFEVQSTNPWIALAHAIRPMLEARG